MRLSREQRWILSNQYRILEHLDPDEAEYYDQAREVIENGYELNYHWIAEHIYEQTMSEGECKEVLRMLEMHSALERSYDNLAGKSSVEAREIRFRGFDGNHETPQLSYARFLIEKEGKFTELADHGDHLNSHMPVLETYRRMLAVWDQLPVERRYELTVADISQVVAARAYPRQDQD